MHICRECGGEANGGEVLPIKTATGHRFVYRCWTCFMAPVQQPCCQRAHEQGYRRGYRDGYWYALWDLAKVVRISDTLWIQLEAFVYATLDAWRHRAYHPPEGRLSREGGPRFRKEWVRKRKEVA